MSYTAFSRFYDRLTENVDYSSKADFISRILKEIKPDCTLVADLACGTGSISVCLDALGYDVIGVDASPDMLSVARSKSPADILYLCQTLQELDLFGTIDAAVCTLDSINHIIDEKALEKTFAKVSLFLEPDGVFIFDMNTEYKHREVLANNCFVYDFDELFCVWQNRTDDDLLTGIDLDFFSREGKLYRRESETFYERAYSLDTIKRILENSNMKLVVQYDDYTSAEPGDKCERIVCVCRKKG